jgi:Sec-independent protein translocase protein TatA
MFGLTGPELVVLAALALVVAGPRSLPEVLRGIGTLVGRARAMRGDRSPGRLDRLDWILLGGAMLLLGTMGLLRR